MICSCLSEVAVRRFGSPTERSSQRVNQGRRHRHPTGSAPCATAASPRTPCDPGVLGQLTALDKGPPRGGSLVRGQGRTGALPGDVPAGDRVGATASRLGKGAVLKRRSGREAAGGRRAPVVNQVPGLLDSWKAQQWPHKVSNTLALQTTDQPDRGCWPRPDNRLGWCERPSRPAQMESVRQTPR